MDVRAEVYFAAGLERMRQARAIHRAGGSYALAKYCGGPAVQCILRAFRWRDRTFDKRHDLQDLLKASDLLAISDAAMRSRGVSDEEVFRYAASLWAAMSELVILWRCAIPRHV